MIKSKNDIAWNTIFDKYKILNQLAVDGFYIISSTKINEYREARLMTKFDHKSQLPAIFIENNLSILPVSRGSYIIGEFETFYHFNTDSTDIVKVRYPANLKSLDFREISSEATAINCAFVAKILHDFTGEDDLFPTVSGRMSSSSFGFNINSSQGEFNIRVENAQVEIDGGFEGEHSLYLIEAKNYISDDFVVRQIYYPFKLWHKRISKNIRPVFLTYTNGFFHLREYMFRDPDHYNSIQLVKYKIYTFYEGFINRKTIENLLNELHVVIEPEIPFPQANSLERIINLCELLNPENFLSKEEITHNYGFDSRQTDYYVNGGRYLGLIEMVKRENLSGCILTPLGKHVFDLPLMQRQIEFIRLILMHAVFNQTFRLFLDTKEIPEKKQIVAILKHVKPYHVLSEKTLHRRSSTIKGWISWIANQIYEESN